MFLVKMDYFPNPISQSIGALKDSIIASNSEGLDWTECERKHFYKHILKLDLRESEANSQRGTWGHEALAEFYTSLQLGKSKDACYKAAMNVLDTRIGQKMLESNQIAVKTLIHLKSLITQYIARSWDDPIKVLEIETTHIVPTTVTGVLYGFKPDLLVEWTAAPWKGDLEVWDHKFPFNFRTQAMARLNPQLPKYIAALRAEGYPIIRGRLNQIRHRNLKDPTPNQIFHRAVYFPKDRELEQATIEQFEVSRRIKERRALDLNAQDRLALRVRSQAVCNKCPMQKLCIAELETGSMIQNPGGYAENIKNTYYTASSYGYVVENGDENDE